ncbi:MULTISPECIES: SDR family oxidoreductase [Corallococcus]|uniref:SDR family oxidoreductase n=1 Tax=Corallococcus TaxID=83461 RepID=UPI00117E0B53|nr:MULTISPECIES: SDR family oxidoreductase [Corallococcus]NBD12000.1 SDR family NAD(P)-dependent oxidoreductase [Corallococcus silvisoli]TSC26001.1 SDR family NAD(P)-dependent oxidoreductase [Corallococcus sp. Z5C101001]
MKPLEGQVVLVAGATRGAGRGIATMLGAAGATVYCTGRSVRGQPASGVGRPETIEETAEQVTALGGRGIAVRVDHLVEAEVEALCQRIRSEAGKLDVLVNDIWGGESLHELGAPFWKQSPRNARLMFERAIVTHIVTSRHAVPLMLERDRGLIVEVTDGDHFGYRGGVAYDLTKMAVIRLAFAMSRDLRRTNVTALAVTPGFLRSEEMLDGFGVTEANWRDAAKQVPDFIASETPSYVGRAVAALAADPRVHQRAGRVFASWTLAREYGFTDLDGSQPHWAEHFERAYGKPYPLADDAAYASWLGGAIETVCPDWPLD